MIQIMNTKDYQAELSNFLQSTIAIQRIVLFYDSETEIVSDSDTQ